MKRFVFIFWVFMAGTVVCSSQVGKDSVHQQNISDLRDSLSVAKNKIEVSKKPLNGFNWTIIPGTIISTPAFTRQILDHHPYFGFNAAIPEKVNVAIRQVSGKEALFYVLIFLVILYALLRAAFPKYFKDLFRLFFRTTIKQRQIREQLMQTPLPSLLLNGFFIIIAGLYVSFLFKHFKADPVNNFWLLFLYCCGAMLVAYVVKYIGLKISGWLFSMQEAANAYIFIVFTVNKMIGILLLPFLFILAFSLDAVYAAGLTISWCILAVLFLYRFILSYKVVRNQVKVNPFHFFLYLCAFEIAPLLLVYKGLLLYFGRTA